MTTHYIQALGVAKCREILKGMPNWATVFDVDACDYFRAGATKVSDIKLDSLRHELSAHDTCEHNFIETTSNGDEQRLHVCSRCGGTKNDVFEDNRTDSCTDITNHISPMTLVIEQNLQEQFQEANEAEDGR